jgi:uncharacterized protein (TIGR02284 family)
MLTRDQVIDALNELVQITEDSHEGYRGAAETAAETDLRVLFHDLSTQRGAMVRELHTNVAGQGGVPAEAGTLFASARRAFAGLRAAVLGNDRQAILREIERGEGEAVRRYERTLERDLPPDVSAVVSRHLYRLRGDRDRIADLRAD